MILRIVFLFSVILCNFFSVCSVVSPRIAVVGAGLSGLTVAHRLHSAGYDVEVYEALNRVGGRVFSVRINGDIAELGGTNIGDGGEALNFLGLANEFNLPLVEYSTSLKLLFEFQDAFYDNQSLKERFRKFGDRTSSIDSVAQQARTMEEFLNIFFKEDVLLGYIYKSFIARYEGSPAENLSLHSLEVFRWMYARDLGVFLSDHDYAVQFKVLKDGNAQLPLALALCLGDKIHLNSPVNRIAKMGDRYAVEFSECADEFDIVVLALPAATYNNIQFDEGIIPSQQLSDILQVQYGFNAKIAFPSSLPFSDVVVTNNYGLWFNVENTIGTLYFGPHESHLSYQNAHAEYVRYLKFLNSCESLSDSQVCELQDVQLSEYDGVIAKIWPLEKYFQGSYSNYYCGENEDARKIIEIDGEKCFAMFAPVGNSIYFAGEHVTVLDEIGTMEAAVEAGERTARMILKYLYQSLGAQ